MLIPRDVLKNSGINFPVLTARKSRVDFSHIRKPVSVKPTVSRIEAEQKKADPDFDLMLYPRDFSEHGGHEC